MKSINHLTDPFNLRTEFIGHLGACCLVPREEFIAKSFTGIKRHGQEFWFFLFKQSHHHGSEPINGSGGFSAGGGHTVGGLPGGDGKVGAVGEGVAINQI